MLRNQEKNGDFVYIVENNLVVRKDVITGVSSDTYIEIVSGLNENDQVMTEISLDIVEGMEVMAIPEADMMGTETELSTATDTSEPETDVSVETETSVESE